MLSVSLNKNLLSSIFLPVLNKSVPMCLLYINVVIIIIVVVIIKNIYIYYYYY